jgi:8-oxo-dGTP diphosphatase
MQYTYPYPRAAITADIIVLKQLENHLYVLLIERKHPPFEGMWALPGGFMDMDETLEETALRELKEETGITGIALKQFHTFSTLGRDPRHRTVTTVFSGYINNNTPKAKAGDDASKVEWFEINKLPLLAFDHEEMMGMFLAQCKVPGAEC